MTKDIQRFADAAMFTAEPMRAGRDADGNIVPSVTLLAMNPDPLGAIAAACKMYKGEVVYNLQDVTDDERREFFEQVQHTHLQAPLEFVNFHFLLEGVTRSFTHQMVRQRTAVYAQESLRFAVTGDLMDRVSVPPSIANGSEQVRDDFWDAIGAIEEAYNKLIAAGVPAEDARALTPHGVATRLHYATDLRNLQEHAGNRLCTQAQFEWRAVWVAILNAIRRFGAEHPSVMPQDRWQFELLASSRLFRPICYKTGKCEFLANFDRHCSIRQKVTDLGQAGVPSEAWDARVDDSSRDGLPGIFPAEWLMDPTAAREGRSSND